MVRYLHSEKRPRGRSLKELTLRKVVGSLAILVWIVGYVAVAAVIGDRIADEHWFWQLLYFPIAGLAWILPMKPLLKWIHSKDEPQDSVDV